ncbi:MAG: hypothetical protein IJB96_12525 [Lachnospira sp.]|nr:hypothetical protein [Lachnospira sp.]
MDWEIVIFFGALIAIALYVMYDTGRKNKAKLEKKLRESFGKMSTKQYSDDEYELISHFYEDTSGDCNVVDDITWNDLGMDSVFKSMNICNSSAGQECLYKMLRCPSDDVNKLKETDRLAKFFAANQDKRLNIQRLFAKLGIVRHISLSDYLGLITELKSGSNVFHYLINVLLIVAFVVCFAIDAAIGVGLIVVAISISVTSYYKYKAKVESYFVCITQLVRIVDAAKSVAALKYEELDSYNKRLKEITDDFSTITKNSSLISSGNVNGSMAEMVLEYMRMLTHIDLIKFNNMVKHLGDREAVMYELMELLGYIEACISVASFREALPYWCEPQLTNSGNTLDVKEAFHPLIAEPVANSINAEKHVLLTGSNASGKSTFLKTIAINALLSQTIYTSVSKEYKAAMFRIYSSMSLRDDLSNNNSYYIVEIKSLKRILDAVAKDSAMPVLCFVDEVLRGTNTVERIAASSEILKSLKFKNVLCFAATHDIELTTLLEKYYDNYHFQEEVTDDDVKFNYKLFKGPATTRNAIKLLNIIGYDKEVISAAEKQAMYFMANGSWQN